MSVGLAVSRFILSVAGIGCFSSLIGCHATPAPTVAPSIPMRSDPVTSEHWSFNDTLPMQVDFEDVWLSEDMSHGWAVGGDGAIAEYRDDQWTLVVHPGAGGLRHLWVHADGQRGWAVGPSVAMQLNNGTWTVDPELRRRLYNTRSEQDVRSMGLLWVAQDGGASAARVLPRRAPYNPESASFQLRPRELRTFDTETDRSRLVRSIALADSGMRGWAVGEFGTLMKFEDDRWSSVPPVVEGFENHLYGVALAPDGRSGWAVGGPNILRLGGGEWTLHQTLDADLRSIWVNAAGDDGWILGSGVAFRLVQGQWQRDSESFIGLSVPRRVHISPSGNRGAAVGSEGTVLTLNDGHWRPAKGSSSGSVQVRSAVLRGETGWAVGIESGGEGAHQDRGVVLKLDDGAWRIDGAASRLAGRGLFGLWQDEASGSGWASGEDGLIMKLEGGSWSIDGAGSEVTDETLYDVALSADQEHGWAVGGSGTIVQRRNGRWRVDTEASAVTEAHLSKVWVDASGSTGWASGGSGGTPSVILKLEGGRWSEHRIAGRSTGDPWEGVKGMTVSPDGSQGWASVGVSRAGPGRDLLKLQDGQWSVDERPRDWTLVGAVYDAAGEATWGVTETAVLAWGVDGWSEADLSPLEEEDMVFPSALAGPGPSGEVWFFPEFMTPVRYQP